MGTIFMISPSFLDAAFTEAKKYDFVLQGYGSFKMGVQGLVKINVIDLLGIVLLVENEKQLGIDALRFLKLCNSMESNKKVLVVSQSNLTTFSNKIKEFRNLRFAILQNIEVVTDDLINRQIFGSILLDNYEPYNLDNNTDRVLVPYRYESLEYKPLISPYLLNCISKVVILDDIKKTLLSDKVYQQYIKDKSILASFREFYIKHLMSYKVDPDILEKAIVDSNVRDPYLYYALIKLVCGEINVT